jgi:PAS domain S-box-containing protein
MAPSKPAIKVSALESAPVHSVLVVDADGRNRDLEIRALRGARMDVIEAGTGAEALRLAVERQPSLVLIGTELPDMDGVDFCCELRALPGTALVPMIHVSARPKSEGEFPEPIEQECYVTLHAPVEPDALSATARAMALAGQAQRQRRELEEKIRRDEHRASEILEGIADPVVAYDKQWRYTYVSRRTAEVLGRTPEEMIGKTIWEIFPEIAGTGLEEASERAWAEGRPVVVERFSPLAGKWLENFIYPFESGAVAQWHDITERRRAEEALHESEARLARTQEFSLVMPLQVSTGGLFLKVPPTFVRFLGFDTEKELLGRSFKEVTHPDEFQAEWDQVQQLLQGEIKSFETEKRFLRKDGSITWGDVNWSVVTGAGGTPVHLLKYVRDINRRKRAEEALRQSEAHARRSLAEIEAIYESSPTGLALLDTSLRFVRVNRRFAEMNGRPAAEHIGKTVQEVNPGLAGIARDAMGRLLETGEPLWNLEVEATIAGHPGVRTWNQHWAPVRDESGQIVSASLAAEEITERKRAVQALAEQKRQFEALAENAPEIIARFDRGLRHTYINEYGARMYGIGRAEILEKTFADLGFTGTAESWKNAFERVFASGRQQTLDYEFESPNFGRQSLSSLLVPELGVHGEVRSVLAITRDVTGLKRAEQELRRNRDLLGFALESSRAGSFDLDLVSQRLEWSPELRKVHGIGPQDPVSFEVWMEGIVPEDRERIRAEAPVLRRKGGGTIQFRIQRRDTGEIRWLEGRGRVLYDEKGAPVRVLGVSIDITEQKRAEEELRESEGQIRELADSMPQLVWINDAAGVPIYANRRWYETIGLDYGDLSRWAEVLHPEDKDRTLNEWQRCMETGERYQIEYRLRVAGGEYRWFLARAIPVHDPQGRIRRWFGTCTDIEDSKRDEEHLRQAQKLESIGLLAGGIAHDFNNLLTGILGNASLVVNEVDPASAERIREVMNGAERAAHLTRQLLAYSGKGQFVTRDLDLSEAISEMSGLMQLSIPKHVDLAVHLQRRLPVVRMDPSQLQQIVMNLVINAAEAIGEDAQGRITVGTSRVEVKQPFVDAIGQNIPAGRYVGIEVADNGSGIERDKLSKIFDPFFTTKFTGRGLGLAAVAGIIRSQLGAITVDSEPGRGSTLRVLFRAAEHGREARPEQPEPGRRGAILVVDDEPSVLGFISAVLRRAGYRVLEAFDGREALAVFDRETDTIDGIVLDVVMPVMGAKELLPELIARRPDLPILLTSGYSESEARRLTAAYPGAAFIQKPYTARQIVQALEEVLGGRKNR